MSEKKDGGPAFPSTFPLYAVDTATGDVREVPEPRGMSLRDYFAAQVMNQMISLSMDGDGGWSCENVAAGCYNLADAMLKAREAPHG